jgi:hypothetical protein
MRAFARELTIGGLSHVAGQWKTDDLEVSGNMLTFYFAPGSSSMAVHIALHELGIPFKSRSLSFAKGEHRAAGFLALNPEGKSRRC